MEKLSLKDLAVPMIKAIDSFNYLLRSHHRRVAVASYHIGKKLGLKDEHLLELVIAASLHDIGALSVKERDMLIQEDVTNPQPHCSMGFHMIKSFDVFRDIAQIIKHHHIIYKDSLKMKDRQVLFASHIIHLADRVDILISTDKHILSQKNDVIEKIEEKVGEVFHPEVFEAFKEVSKKDIFWIDIDNMSVSQLFRKIEFSLDFDLSLDNTVEFALTMSRIIDFRSKFTASHSYTVAHLAEQIGKYFRFDDEKCKKLLIAGYLHDIGKIGIDPGLIEKNGPLTDDEFNMMKLHSYYTGQILGELNTSEWFQEIVRWAEYHHEKNDGTGYPHGIADEELDIGSKILAFADVITALLEDRPYRKGMDLEKAFTILREELAPKISSKLFQVIEQNKEEINQVVTRCKEYSMNEYNSDN